MLKISYWQCKKKYSLRRNPSLRWDLQGCVTATGILRTYRISQYRACLLPSVPCHSVYGCSHVIEMNESTKSLPFDFISGFRFVLRNKQKRIFHIHTRLCHVFRYFILFFFFIGVCYSAASLPPTATNHVTPLTYGRSSASTVNSAQGYSSAAY